MTDHNDAWARGLDNETLATGVRSLAPLLVGSHRADEALPVVREAARRIEAPDDELNDDEHKAARLIDRDEQLMSFAATCGSDDLELRLIEEIKRNGLDINVGNIDFVKLMNQFQNT